MSADRAARQAAYYARIVPILGDGLRACRIAVCGTAAVAGAVERLAGCRALRWWIADDASLTAAHPLLRGGGGRVGDPAGPALAAALRDHNGWEDGWAFTQRPALTATTYPAHLAELRSDPPDLLLGGGDRATLAHLGAFARALDIPALLVAHYVGADPTAACLALLPGDGGAGRDWPDLCAALGHPSLTDPAALPPTTAAWHTWAVANGLAALLARALLLHGTPHSASDLDAFLWTAHRTTVLCGTPAWPNTVRYVNLATSGPRPVVGRQSSVVSDEGPGVRGQGSGSEVKELPSAQHLTLNTQHSSHSAIVVGCGSLGSLVARGLAAGGLRRLTLVDGEQVDAANPVRQWFHTDQVGRPKVAALAHNLTALWGPTASWTETALEDGATVLSSDAGQVTLIPTALGASRAEVARFRRLLRATRPSVVVLTTGSSVDYALARVLRRLDIPHISGRCYPRARYFEAILVDGRRGPCFGCLRGHLYTGPAPAPTPEEALRYDRPTAPGELQAEPATVVESGRAADTLALLAAALALPRRARPPWLTALLAAEQTCLIGGNTAGPAYDPTTGQTGWAYGIGLPGQLVAFGVDQILGCGPAQVCADCGRVLRVAYAVA